MHTNQSQTPTPQGLGRAPLMAMASTYFLGVFNDNFFKQAAMLTAVSAGLSTLQGTATMLFSLPFILFSVYGGWLADHFPKRRVVIAVKFLELLAMTLGGFGLLSGSWPCILAMVFLMGLQSALFGPALNGSIPEIYPDAQVTKANAVLKLATTLAILIGIAMAGITLDMKQPNIHAIPFGLLATCSTVILVSILGIISGFLIHSRPAAASRKPFPWSGPMQSIRDLMELRQDRPLFLAIGGDAFFYCVASLTVLTLNTLGLSQLSLSQTATSLLPVWLMIGICGGSFLAARLTSVNHWTHVPAPAALSMGAGLILTGFCASLPEQARNAALPLALIITGCSGGLFLIPLTSFIQLRPAAHEKGRVIAVAGFTSFCGILLSGQIFSWFDTSLSPDRILQVLGLFCMAIALVTGLLIGGRKIVLTVLFQGLARAALSLRYRLRVRDNLKKQHTPEKSVLLLANHPALIDPLILMSLLQKRFAPRPLADQDQVNRPLIKTVTGLVNAITIPDPTRQGNRGAQAVRKALKTVIQALKNGDNVLLYPAGHLMRTNQEKIGAARAVEEILKAIPEQRVVLIRTSGLWGSSFGWYNGSPPSPMKFIKKYLISLTANGIFFGPRRQVTVELAEAGGLPITEGRLALNRSLEEFYNAGSQTPAHVPYTWFESADVQDKNLHQHQSGDLSQIPHSISQVVIARLKEMSGSPNISPDDRLAGDLAMDSLSLMELIGWLEKEFGFSPGDPASLQTVGDCLLLAAGCTVEKSARELQPLKLNWFGAVQSRELSLPKGKSITEVFLHMAAQQMDQPIIADQRSGVLSYRRIMAAIHLLKPKFESLPGNRLGVMLPASAGASLTYLSSLFSGKTPVMLNWTIGPGQMAHCCQEAGISHIITSKALLNKLESQGIDLSGVTCQWLCLEDLAAASWPAKISALLKTYLPWSLLRRCQPPETAAILFTSGSESAPKGVPLTHANILANLGDFSRIAPVRRDDRLLAMLPPFHSLGLVGTMIMPLCLGIRTAYHANPTESLTLARFIEHYRLSVMIGTPTFLSGILTAGSRQQLSSLRVALTGAEKCPVHLFESLARNCPKAILCEGYGITECSPLVSMADPRQSPQGSIGRVLPSMQYAVVDPENGKRVEEGCQGVLLVKGPNVFHGYLNQEVNKGFQKFEGERWYRTGDLVQETASGDLLFKGRLKRFIKLAGEMISLPAIENALLTGTEQASDEGPLLAVEATPVEENPEIVLFTTLDLKREEVNATIRQAGLSGLHNIRRLIRVDAIPILGTGKTNYRQLQAEFLHA